LPPWTPSGMLSVVEDRSFAPDNVSDGAVAPNKMTFRPNTPLHRSAVIVLALYAGAFFGQIFCVLPMSHVESRLQVRGELPAAYAASQHGQHSGAPGHDHSGVCAVVACGSAVVTTPDHGLAPTGRLSIPQVAYAHGTIPPEPDLVLPPPRSA
jgi:hypothetical protein